MNEWLRDKKRWEEIRTEAKYEPLRIALDKYYRDIKDMEIPNLKFSIFMKSIKTGDRKVFEDVYFLRRKMLTAYVLMSLVYPENPEYLSKLEDVVCAILEEYTWCLPAHLPADRLNTPCHIDLFAAETGLYMAEVKYIFSDRLSPLIIERITAELDRRIVQSFKNNKFVFEEFASNWAGVCAGSVGTTLLYENLDVYMEVKPRIESCMAKYLQSIDDEGVSSEGFSYLNYGLCFHMLYNDSLKSETFDRIDYNKAEKIKRAAQFMADVNMSRNLVYSFADGGSGLGCNTWFIKCLRENASDELPAFYGSALCSTQTSVAIRNFLAYEPYDDSTTVNKLSYYKNFGCVIARNDTYSIGIKAGHNQEEHNHNDVASFAVVAKNKQLLCDLGAPLYTMHSLRAENYDKVIERSSFGHNVPIINGTPQRFGRQYCGEMKVEGNHITIDFAKAYSVEINKLTRILDLMEDKILLSDEFDENVSWQERFVTETDPQLLKDGIKIDCLNMLFDTDKLDTEIERIITKSHSNTDRVVYLITLTPKNGENRADFTIAFDEGTTREA